MFAIDLSPADAADPHEIPELLSGRHGACLAGDPGRAGRWR
jgi:hypothetical protein